MTNLDDIFTNIEKALLVDSCVEFRQCLEHLKRNEDDLPPAIASYVKAVLENTKDVHEGLEDSLFKHLDEAKESTL